MAKPHEPRSKRRERPNAKMYLYYGNLLPFEKGSLRKNRIPATSGQRLLHAESLRHRLSRLQSPRSSSSACFSFADGTARSKQVKHPVRGNRTAVTLAVSTHEAWRAQAQEIIMLPFLSGLLPFRSRIAAKQQANRQIARGKFRPAFERLETRETPAAIATFVQDINQGPNPSSPTEPVRYQGIILFAAEDSFHGRELWRTDGTPAGTQLVRDINLGDKGSDPQHLTVAGKFLYFSADDGIFGRELWRTDGTLAGTMLVRDIHVGPLGSDPTELIEFTDRPGFNPSTRLYFSANDGLHGRELWRSNGTVASTQLVADINLGPADSSPTYLTVVPRPDLNPVPRALYFRADDGIHGAELWRTTAKRPNRLITTELVKDIRPGPAGSNPFNLASVGPTLYFGADDGFTGKELWRTLPRPNITYQVKDINPGPKDSLIESPAALMAQVFVPFRQPRLTRPRLFFSADNGAVGQELWVSDGSLNGTQLVRDINPGPNGSNPMMQQHPLAQRRALTLTVTPASFDNPRPAEVLLFSAADGFFGRELWRSDGTFTGTNLVRDINSGAADGIQGELVGIVVKNVAYFAANNGVTLFNTELWSSTGTPAGTNLVQDINAGSGASDPNNFEFLRRTSTLFFAADNGIIGRELWKLPV